METLQNYKQYLTTEGRATRSEYWGVYLSTWLILAIVTMLFFALTITGMMGVVIGSIIMIASAVILTWAMLATSIRRCRDAGISPWFTLSFLVPYINFIVFIVFGVLNTDKDTEHGPAD
jgi:uncharacterized membrane protein YhaH (DUF805 family)